jgi:hypothetical protein
MMIDELQGRIWEVVEEADEADGRGRGGGWMACVAVRRYSRLGVNECRLL